MQLSSKARKAVAAGLAASTILWASVGMIPQFAAAAVHSDGCLVLSGGVVWLVTGGTRRGFTSAEVFMSHGYNFSQVVTASAEDVALPVGPIMTYADGTLVKGPSDPLVYLVTGGQKRGFTTGAVFTGLGFSFSNIQSAPANTFADLPTGANLDNATERHGAGVLVNASGTIWKMTATGRMGVPDMTVFNSYGWSFAKVIAANSADTAAANEGVVAARAGCAQAPTPTGSINVTLAGPASTTLINDESQAVLANFVFTGSGIVTAVTMQRTGISADTSLSNVYLFDGDVRVTDAASVTSGSMINFSNSSGLFSVSGSKTISARADMAATAGETIGVRLTAVTLSSGSVGGLPISGNNHTIATATLAGADLSTAPTGSGDTDPGTDINVWQGTISVTTRDVVLTRLALRQIGSIQSVDIKNFRLFVDGVEVASQVSLDANGYVTFVLSKTLATGSRVLKVIADVIGGSGRTVQMSLRGAYDVKVIDSQYNAAPVVTATGDAFPYDPAAFTVNAGTVTVVKASTSQANNVTVGGSDVSLGTWTVTVYGEAVKIETLTVGIDVNGTDADNTFRNGRVMINGAQYGSTTHVAAVDSAATGQSFTVNFMVNPGSPATVEFRSDIFDNEDTNQVALLTTTTVQATLVAGSGNAVPQVSLGTLAVPSAEVDANSLTIASGSIALASTPSYPAQSTVAPQSSYKLASFDLTGNATEAVNLNTIAIGFAGNGTFDPSSDLSNVFLKYGGKTSSIKGTVADGSITSLANSWSVSETLPIDGSLTVEVWATLGSSIAAAGSDDTMITYMRVTGITAGSGTTVYADVDSDTVATDNGATGQTITIEDGTLTVSLDASAPASILVDDSGTKVTGAWKFESLYDSFTVTDIIFTIANVSAVSTVTLKNGSTVVASKPAAATTTFNNVSVPVAANSNAVLTVELTMASVGVGGGTSASSLLTTLTSATRRNSQGTSAAVTEASADPAGNVMYVYKAIPTITYVSLADTLLAAGTRVIAKFTVNTNGTGTIAWKQAMVEITMSGATGPALSAFSIWDVTGGANNQVTAAETIQNADNSGTATTCDTEDETCELLILVGVTIDDNVEEAISSSKTYEIRATVGGTIGTGDFVSASIETYLAHAANDIADTRENDTTVNDTAFLWSDRSASSHDTGTADWTNDNLLKFLPTATWTLLPPT